MNNHLKKLFFFVAIFFMVSCTKKDDAVPVKQGFLEQFIKDDPQIKIQKVKETTLINWENATYKGFIFKPLSNIRITAIGGKIAVKGTYKIEIYSDGFLASDTLFKGSINITDTEKFQYKDIANSFKLVANQSYLIRYFNENHDSVYEAVLPTSYKPVNRNYLPLKVGDIELEKTYFTYHHKPYGEYIMIGLGADTGPTISGLVDFKYEVIK